ncbi:hypothetical protein QYZ43_11240 [Vibrio parahaemolyticus]|nr:hypothetical protein [Vibrio parahaemolyticus]MDN4714205.1 hypothetical protein [Vibrio parahaemolyticus]MDN4718076.1 hypothetical protein [Vibrio parahaemolyticus]MDN4721286.1 hypothetical protein [Vibrio parahaemolyticus]MDN4725573.1 hypothetical protein [Vibrio parahaemolyticus]
MSKDKMKLKKYDVALATRNFEIELFWKRSVFFGDLLLRRLSAMPPLQKIVQYWLLHSLVSVLSALSLGVSLIEVANIGKKTGNQLSLI